MKYYTSIISLFLLILYSFAMAEENNKEKAKFYAQKANFFEFKRKDYDKAIEMYRKAIELDPNNFEYHFHLGSTLAWKKKMYNEAIKEFQKALEIDPNNWWVPFVYAQLGGAYMEVGEYDEAIKAIKNDMESLNSDKYHDSLRKNGYAGAYLALEKIYKKKGDLVQAEEMAKKAEEFKKLAEIATKEFNKKFDEEMDKNIKFRRRLRMEVLAPSVMDDLLQIFIPLTVILIFISLVYIIQRKRREATEDSEVKWGIKEIVIIYLSVEILSEVIYNILYLTVAIKGEIICNMSSAFFHLLLIFLIIYYVKGKYKQPMRNIGFKKEKLMRDVAVGLAGGIGTIFLIIGVGGTISLLLSFLGSGVEKFVETVIQSSSSEDMKQLFSQTQSFHLLLFYFLVETVLCPLSEEMFFRGFIYSAFRKIIGIRWAMVLSSLFFAMYHTEPIMITSFLSGLVCAYLYERTKSLIPCIVAHSFLNAKSAILVYFFPSYFS